MRSVRSHDSILDGSGQATFHINPFWTATLWCPLLIQLVIVIQHHCCNLRHPRYRNQCSHRYSTRENPASCHWSSSNKRCASFTRWPPNRFDKPVIPQEPKLRFLKSRDDRDIKYQKNKMTRYRSSASPCSLPRSRQHCNNHPLIFAPASLCPWIASLELLRAA